MVFVHLSSLILNSGLQLGRWAGWQGAPGPLTQWAAGPVLGWSTSDEQAPRMGRDKTDWGCNYGSGWL